MSNSNSTPLVNQEYWDQLAGKENPTLGDFMSLINVISDPAAIAEKEDTIAICDSVSDGMKRVEAIDRELAEQVEYAEEVIADLDAVLNGQAGLQLTKAYEEALKIVSDENVPDIVKKPMQDIVNAVESNKELKDFIDTKGHAMITAEQFAKDHPVMLKLYQAKQSLKDSIETINTARANMKVQTETMIGNVKTAAYAASIKMADGYSSIKTSVWETANRNLQAVASGYNTAVTEFEKFAEKAKERIKEVINSVEVFKDKFMDMISLGLHSKLESGKTKDFYEQNKKKVQDKLSNLRASYEVGTAKDDILEKKLESKLSSLEKKIKKMEKKEAFRGTTHSEYWKDVSENAFLWGRLSENGRETGYARSPLQASIDGYQGAIQLTRSTISKGKEAYEKADAAFQKAVDDLARNARNKGREIALAGTNFVANVYDKLSENYAKRAKRLESKQNQLAVVDSQLFAKKVEIQKILHDLTEVSPFKAPAFEPSPQIVAQIEQLRNLNPKENAEIAMSIRLLENVIKKESKAHEKYVSELKSEFDDKVSGLQSELAHLEKQIGLNLKEMANIVGQLESTLEKGAKVAEKESQITQKGIEIMDGIERE